ncbi:hypothetical protein [uncultured Methanobrevibacter sp.]|uniref:hypothetical protein n=1 Tax=uncultured Methanobrevibacter sp. TaxID=253161 RepID=UPI0025E8FAFF|nr:hypothetical protein [uncultured Methanobrevibacter sp.]
MVFTLLQVILVLTTGTKIVTSASVLTPSCSHSNRYFPLDRFLTTHSAYPYSSVVTLAILIPFN